MVHFGRFRRGQIYGGKSILWQKVVKDKFFRFGRRLPGQLLGPHGRIVYESGQNSGGLPEVIWEKMIVIIHIAMVSPGFVVERILDELEPRNANSIEGKVIRGSGIM